MRSCEDVRNVAELQSRLSFDLFKRGDFRGVGGLYHPKVKFQFNVPRTVLPGGGEALVGREALLDVLKFMYLSYEWLDHRVTELRTCGNQVVILRRHLSRNRGSGGIYDQQCCTLYRFQDGYIDQVEDYSDTEVMRRLLQGEDKFDDLARPPVEIERVGHWPNQLLHSPRGVGWRGIGESSTPRARLDADMRKPLPRELTRFVD